MITQTRYGQQWGLQNDLNTGRDIHAEAAWDIYTGSSNNIIAIIDNGIDINHPDLNSKIDGGDIVFGSHGVKVVGVAAAETNNGTEGIAGVDWNARIHFRSYGEDFVDVYNAIIAAVNYSPNVVVLNNSYSLGHDGLVGDNPLTVRQAFAYAYKANRTSVVAMGNHQDTQPNAVAYPAGWDNLLAVGASTITDGIWASSAQGSHIDVAAPGVDIVTTDIGSAHYTTTLGTSVATPFVSGLASLLKGYNANLANDDIYSIIRLSADDINNPGANDGTGPGFDNASGAGRINAERALNLLRYPYSLNQWSTVGGTVSSSSAFYNLQLYTIPGLAAGTYQGKKARSPKSRYFSAIFLPNNCRLGSRTVNNRVEHREPQFWGRLLRGGSWNTH